ncbi:YgjV family protein [uncultured Methanobrevibacter sp.]|uniref:YgjV family protein n=1 Tax=uncultured Methanobrevibacter sp. TaxID=253161 RepID=UPI0025FB6576|nr:YgjV family protein [uncultured Methanobrevibacter sp.]
MDLATTIMSLPTNIIIGNFISLIAGIFIIASLIINDDKKAYTFQLLNTLTLVIASFFFNSIVGAVIMAIASVRIYMVIKDRFTIRWTIFFLILSVVIGLWVNTLGLVGLIPIVAVIQITICNYAYKDIRWIKLSFIVNESFYIFYFFLIYDYVSTLIQILTVVIGCVSYVKLVSDRNAAEKKTNQNPT